MIDYICERLRYYVEELVELNNRAVRTVDTDAIPPPVPACLFGQQMIGIPTTYHLQCDISVPYTTVNAHARDIAGAFEIVLPMLQYGRQDSYRWIQRQYGDNSLGPFREHSSDHDAQIVLAHKHTGVRLVFLSDARDTVYEILAEYTKTAMAYIQEMEVLYSLESTLAQGLPHD